MDYNTLTVVKLKEELKNRDIAITNLKLKKDLIDRLTQDDEEKAQTEDTPAQVTAAEPEEDDDAHQSLPEPEAPALEQNGTPTAVAAPHVSEAHRSPSAPAVDDKTHVEVPLENGQDEDHKDAPTEEPQETLPALAPAPAPAPAIHAPEQTATKDDVLEVAQPAPAAGAKEEPSAPVPNDNTPSAMDVDEPASSDKKRKRRSLTPAMSEEVVKKKLKQETDDPVHLQRDDDPAGNEVAMPDVPLEDAHIKMQPMATSDDMVDISHAAPSRTTRSPNERRFKELINPAESEPVNSAPEPEEDITVSPALHPATRALYVRHLVRPINPNAFRDHLEELAKPPDHKASSESLIEDCYVDALRTHAFVLFTSISAASRVRASVHARVWPQESMRKPLWADFFPEERLQEWIQVERSSGTRPSQAKRWELSYDKLHDTVDVRLVEATSTPHRPSTQAGVPPTAAPTGPRESVSSNRRPSFPSEDHRRPSQSLAAPPSRSKPVQEEASAPFLELDKLFRFTSTKPKLYWQPVHQDLAEDRLDELDRETSRDWDPRLDARRNGDSLGRGLDQLKRYTFEDGDVLVDGGPEFGGGRAFGGARGGNRGHGHGNGRGRRPPTDSYRGS